jgi:hypothetical protein
MFVAVPFLSLLGIGIVCVALGCADPFAAIAAAAALNLPRRAGIVVVAAVWLLDQAVGFGLRHYPQDPSTIAWGVGIGVAAFAAFAIARIAAKNPLFAFLGAFAAYEAVLVLFSLRLGGWDAYAPHWMIQIFSINFAWFAGAHIILRVLARRPLFGTAALR